ncbi:UNVERIFIED_CONTAM: hypothetical protein GTU68_045442 [Idotea baltica]|nr:hypothetical protein [Idotea baltica]
MHLSETYGNTLVLDGLIQVTQRDEFPYQEMLANLPLQCHPNPRDVLVIGGGDGGVVREVTKHPQVENIVLCEIDEDVIEVSKRFLPFCAKGFDSPKLKIVVEDGFKFLESNKGKFDVIITDSSDPIGPGESLFKKEFYELIKNSLKNDGILCSQGKKSISFVLDVQRVSCR